MGDPLLLVAVIGLGLSALASAIRLIDWFLHSDPKAIANAGRWAAVGLAMIIAIYRVRLTVNVDEVDTLKG